MPPTCALRLREGGAEYPLRCFAAPGPSEPYFAGTNFIAPEFMQYRR